jgi:outer membrane protein TolC
VVLSAGSVWAQQAPAPLTLEESIKIALEQNLNLQFATEGVKGSEFRTKSAWADFFAPWTGEYKYTRSSSPVAIGAAQVVGFSGERGSSRDVFDFNTTINQPLFAGGAISSNYRLEKLGLGISKENVEVVKRNIVVAARVGYFNILTAEKFVDVAKQAVKQFEAQLEVSKAFFEVGLVAKNDVLQAEVRLANAIQAQVTVENNAAIAKAQFNILLRRDVNTPFSVVDILEYKPFPVQFEESLDEALRQRPEIKVADLNIGQTKEAVKIAQSGYYPTVSLAGNYDRLSDAANLHGDLADDRWTIQGLATFTFFDWGKISSQVGESKVKVSQAQTSKSQLVETITLEVKQDYLNMLQAEKNIGVAQKSVEQAEENLRMNEERYKYQVATATDVLDAVVLLAQTKVNYYRALSDFNIARAQLDRAMGRMYP